MKRTKFFIFGAIALIALAGCSTETTETPPPITSGTSIIDFDAASGALKQTEPLTLSKAANAEKTLKAADGWDSYLWLVDDAEILGIEQELTLKAGTLEKGTHKLVLIITTEEGTPYSSPAITVMVTN